MLSDGQNRGNMTYPSTNSLSSGSNSARAQSDRTSVPAPTQTTSQSGNNSHRHPSIANPHQSPMQSPSDFHYSFEPSSSNVSRLISQEFDKPSQNLRSTTTTGVVQTSRHSSSYESGISSAYRRTGFEASHPASSDYHLPDRHTSHNPPISTIRSAHSLTAPPPESRAFHQGQNDEHGVCGTGHSNRLHSPRATPYSPIRPEIYSREIFQGSTTSPTNTCATVDNIHFPHPQSGYSEPLPCEMYTSCSPDFQIRFPSGGRSSDGVIRESEVTEGVGLNINHRTSSSTTITTTLHMDVNVTTDQPIAMDTARIRLSSIPMSNGTPPQAAIIPSAPGPPFSSALHRHYPSSSHASMSVSAQGSALELTAQVTYIPPAQPQLYSIYEEQQNQRAESPPLSLSHHATYPSISTEPETPTMSKASSEQHAETQINPARLESKSGPRLPAQRKKKKAKMHVCPQCHKEFPRPSGLVTHMNTHSNTKPYACTYQGCDRTFSVRSNAKRHLKTHAAPPTLHSDLKLLDPPAITPLTGPVATFGKTDLPRPAFIGFEPVIIGGGSIGTGTRDTTQEGPIVDGRSVRGTSTSREAAGHGIATQLSSTTSNYPAPAFFKLRWVPVSIASERSNVKQFMDSDDRRPHVESKGDQGSSLNVGNERRVSGQSKVSSSYGNSRARAGRRPE